MGKKSKTTSPTKPVVVDDETLKKVNEFKTEGSKLFVGKDYSKAVDAYEKAIKLLPDSSELAADLYSNKAACYYQQKRYKEAVKECNSALQIAPSLGKALKSRAKALEQQGLYKQALADVQALNKAEGASDETRDSERRLKEIMSGRRPAGSVAAASGAPANRPGARATNKPSMPYTFTAKCSLGNETRLVHMSPNVNYADLYAAVQDKFPAAGPVALKYVDKDGDLVTITSRLDIQNAMTEVLASYERQMAGPHGPKLLAQAALPPMRVQVMPVASAADVPQPPVEEQMERQQLMAQQRLKQQQAQQRQVQQAGPQAAQQEQQFEVDDWLIDFANLFREVSGVDPDRHVDFHNAGWEATTRAMEATVHSDKALPIFDKAIDRFKEVTCTGLLNWGNVHTCIAHKYLDEAAAAGAELSTVLAKVTAELDKAEAQFVQAAAFKPDFTDLLLARGQIEAERAKLAAGLLVKNPPPPTIDESMPAAQKDKVQAEFSAAVAAALRDGLAKVSAASAKAGDAHLDKALAWYGKALEAAAAADKERQDKAGEKKEQAAAAAAAPDVTLVSQVEIMHGNLLYEWSQVRAAVGAASWRAMLDDAVALFKKAGCTEADIRGALKNHTQVAQLDLGPDPEPEPEPAAAEQAKQQQAEPKAEPKAKGLPSLERKKK